MNQSEFNASGAGDSQDRIILRRLLEARGEWVPRPELSRLSGAAAVNSRAARLRKKGFDVLNECQRKGRRVLSFYRIPVKE